MMLVVGMVVVESVGRSTTPCWISIGRLMFGGREKPLPPHNICNISHEVGLGSLYVKACCRSRRNSIIWRRILGSRWGHIGWEEVQRHLWGEEDGFGGGVGKAGVRIFR